MIEIGCSVAGMKKINENIVFYLALEINARYAFING
jgi:hypothetical protein